MHPMIDAEKCVGCFSCIRACPMGVLAKGEKTPYPRAGFRCIACMHCTAICPTQAVTFEELSQEALYPPVPEEPLERLVVSRRSVRKFLPRLPKREVIQWALDRAEYAPSGKNVHATHWTVLWGTEVTRSIVNQALELCRTTGEAPELPKLYAKGVNLLTCDAPCVIIGWSPEDCLNPVVDTVVAMTTVELLLQSKGLSTCWGGYLNQLAHHHPALRQALGIPEGSQLRCALMVGYPHREHYRNIPYRPAAKIQWLEQK